MTLVAVPLLLALIEVGDHGPGIVTAIDGRTGEELWTAALGTGAESRSVISVDLYEDVLVIAAGRTGAGCNHDTVWTTFRSEDR